MPKEKKNIFEIKTTAYYVAQLYKLCCYWVEIDLKVPIQFILPQLFIILCR